LKLKDPSCNVGLAVSRDESIMAVSNSASCRITLYALPSGHAIRVVGDEGSGPGQFYYPHKLCFTPDGTLLVSEWENRRLQEVTLTGHHVRFIGEDVFQSSVAGVDASKDFIIASQPDETDSDLVVFDFRTGAFLRRFSTFDRTASVVDAMDSGCCGLRISPDGYHMLVAQFLTNRVSVYSLLSGRLVRQFGLSDELTEPQDVCVSDSGEIIVANSGYQRVCVFSPSDGRMLREFGSHGEDECTFAVPNAVCCIQGKLYVLNRDSDELQVFT
jgi:sugar lactone lactonase YvrE